MIKERKNQIKTFYFVSKIKIRFYCTTCKNGNIKEILIELKNRTKISFGFIPDFYPLFYCLYPLLFIMRNPNKMPLHSSWDKIECGTLFDFLRKVKK
jgi:hypothetical protein